MGYANVINFGGIRIAGLSGIFKAADYHKGHHEIPPYNPGTAHSVYHVRNLEVFRLSQIKNRSMFLYLMIGRLMSIIMVTVQSCYILNHSLLMRSMPTL